MIQPLRRRHRRLIVALFIALAVAGYAPPMPPKLARFVRRVVTVLGLSVAVSSVAIAFGHVTLTGGTFEFNQARTVSGTVVEHPYPRFRPDSGERQGAAWALLVAPGKHGAEPLIRGLNGRRVQIEAKRIERGPWQMLEIQSQTPRAPSEFALPESLATATADANSVALSGEPVDVAGSLSHDGG
jgi:hypothetical protein